MKAFESARLTTAPRCPCCSAVLDGYTAVSEGRGPRDGDPTVCSYCATVLVFTVVPPAAGLVLRQATPAEIERLTVEAPELPSVVAAIRRTIAEHGPPPPGVLDRFAGRH